MGYTCFVNRLRSALLASLWLLAASGCATRSSYGPVPAERVGFLERAVQNSQHGLTVTVAVPTPAEARQLFGFKAGNNGIQAVWLEIANTTDEDFWLMTHAMDPEYFSALEVAWIGRSKYRKGARSDMEAYLHSHAMPFHVPKGQTVSGYVFVNQTLGARHVRAELIAERQGLVTFDFLVEIPGLSTDYQRVDFHNLYTTFEDLDEAEFRDWLERQPATVTNAKKTKLGDPLNIVVVGTEHAIFSPFVRAGWHVTETMSTSSTWRTIMSSVFRKEYRYSPISALYVYDRPQDIALQKARATVDERNHLRLWLAPVTFHGELVWLGQISRDIGVRFTTQSPTISTHKIDPDVDETRAYLIQDLAYAQGLRAFAYVNGVGEAPIEKPRANLTGDPYFTDGLRVVLFMSEDRIQVDHVDLIEWTQLP